MQRVFVCFLEEIEDSKKAFRNYLTFSREDEFSVLPSKSAIVDEKTPGQRSGNKKRTTILSASQHTLGPSCFYLALKD
jgi:hypothetical protein